VVVSLQQIAIDHEVVQLQEEAQLNREGGELVVGQHEHVELTQVANVAHCTFTHMLWSQILSQTNKEVRYLILRRMKRMKNGQEKEE
jgi:hypothetical protein